MPVSKGRKSLIPPMNKWRFPNEATPPGSANYYIARFAASAQRDRIAAWFAWFAHLDQIVEKAKDPGVARLKLDWWREETHFMHRQAARHPLAQALSQYINADWQIMPMHRILDAIEQRILKQMPHDLTAFQQQCAQQGGSRAILLANSADPDRQNQAEWLGGYHAMVLRIQHLGKDIQQHDLSLPQTWLNQHGIQRIQLENGEDIPALAEAVQALLPSVEQKLLDERSRLKQQIALHTPLRMAVQAWYLSRQMRKKGYASHQHEFELTPLQYLWAAWRMG